MGGTWTGAEEEEGQWDGWGRGRDEEGEEPLAFDGGGRDGDEGFVLETECGGELRPSFFPLAALSLFGFADTSCPWSLSRRSFNQ